MLDRIFLLTTSHGQLDQVTKLVSSLHCFVSSVSNIAVDFVLVESFLPPEEYECIFEKYSSDSMSFSIVPADPCSFWTSSVFKGLSFISESKFASGPEFNARILLMNSDVLPSAWDFLLSQKSLLETFVTLDGSGRVQRSGFTVPCPYFARHKYRSFQDKFPSDDWNCQAVPTRMILFPYASLSQIKKIRFIEYLLPHYSADFVLTGYLSACLRAPWLVRSDYSLGEDMRTTGIKNIESVSLSHIASFFAGRKSTFNFSDAFLFPVIFSALALPWYCVLTYTLSAWLKYILRVVWVFVVRFGGLSK